MSTLVRSTRAPEKLFFVSQQVMEPLTPTDPAYGAYNAEMRLKDQEIAALQAKCAALEDQVLQLSPCMSAEAVAFRRSKVVSDPDPDPE